ncbi:MAG: thiamine pyrophosphate-binding protein [bacterium]
MKRTGAWQIRYALEKLGVKHTFGIPGVHVTELYDELLKSEQIEPVLIAAEASGSFIAEAIGRLSGKPAVLLLVPGPGLSYALTAIGEAMLDGIPLLVITGGIRKDMNYTYQLHEIDQIGMVTAWTKYARRVEQSDEIIPALFDAWNHCVEGEPGPAVVEIPTNLMLFQTEIAEPVPDFTAAESETSYDAESIKRAVNLLKEAENPAIFVGWGAREATDELIKLAETLQAPVATTLQGLSVFPANHPLHTGMSFGHAAVPAAQQAFKNCDVMLAVGTRFAEIATGSYGVKVPEKLIHLDINPQVFNKNYPAMLAIEGDAKSSITELNHQFEGFKKPKNSQLHTLIKQQKQAYAQAWLKHDSGERVNPKRFFDALRLQLADTDPLVLDDGNHTFLAAELFPVLSSKAFISPTDFNAMGYAVPAAIGARIEHSEGRVAAVIGDGAFRMSCMELTTAVALQSKIVFFVFSDGELAQIAQAQDIPYSRKPCTRLPTLNLDLFAQSVGCQFYALKHDEEIEKVMDQAFNACEQGPVLVDVNIDYSKKTAFTQGAVKANLQRFALADKLRFVSRAIWRKVRR